MTKAGRIGNVITGLIMVAFGFFMALVPSTVYSLIIHILGFTLILSGIRSLVYYISMARHMVGGRTVLYRAVIVLDIGIFTLSLADVPFIFVILYLAGIHGFAGVIDILGALESKRLQAGSWKFKLSTGIVNVIIACLCLAFLGKGYVAAEIYSLGLMYSGIIRIIQAFRKTAVVYIQ